MYSCVKLLMIMLSGKICFKSFIMRAVIKDGRILIDGLQIDTDKITYTQGSSLMYSHVRSVSAMTLPNLKKHYILSG